MQEPLLEGQSGAASGALGKKQWTESAGSDGWSLGLVGKRLFAFWSDDLLRSRTGAHAALVLLALLVVALSGNSFFTASFGRSSRPAVFLQDPETQTLAAEAPSLVQESYALLPVAPRTQESGTILIRDAVPYTIIPDRSVDEISTYSVRSGDTIVGIAAQLGIAPETIMWANARLEDNPDLLRVGQELTILPVDGVYHQVGEGDTIEKIATTFEVEPSAVIAYSLNALDIENPQITVGQWLVVPGGTKPYVPRKVVATAYTGPVPEGAQGTGIFGWPASGKITQGYWDRHRAVDIGAWEGAPILAADAGYVIGVGWDDTGYGRMVLIDHGNGYQTLYAHLNVYYVEEGTAVAKGQALGEMGQTGNATGPHLHFELRQSSVQRNPLGFLP